VVEGLPKMYKALSSTPSSEKKRKKKGIKEGRKEGRKEGKKKERKKDRNKGLGGWEYISVVEFLSSKQEAVDYHP
jgi:hypothetical protein